MSHKYKRIDLLEIATRHMILSLNSSDPDGQKQIDAVKCMQLAALAIRDTIKRPSNAEIFQHRMERIVEIANKYNQKNPEND